MPIEVAWVFCGAYSPWVDGRLANPSGAGAGAFRFGDEASGLPGIAAEGLACSVAGAGAAAGVPAAGNASGSAQGGDQAAAPELPGATAGAVSGRGSATAPGSRDLI